MQLKHGCGDSILLSENMLYDLSCFNSYFLVSVPVPLHGTEKGIYDEVTSIFMCHSSTLLFSTSFPFVLLCTI